MNVLIARSQALAWERRSGGSASSFFPSEALYSLPGWSLGTQIRRLCLHFPTEAEPLDIGSQAEPRNQLKEFVSLPVDIYSLPGWSLVTHIRRLCLHFLAEAQPLDMGSQADPGNQSNPKSKIQNRLPSRAQIIQKSIARIGPNQSNHNIRQTSQTRINKITRFPPRPKLIFKNVQSLKIIKLAQVLRKIN